MLVVMFSPVHSIISFNEVTGRKPVLLKREKDTEEEPKSRLKLILLKINSSEEKKILSLRILLL